MEEIDKKTLENHTKALNRVADVLDDFIEGLPGFVKQLARNEVLLHSQQQRAKTKSQIEQDIETYEQKKKEVHEKTEKKKETPAASNKKGDQ